MMLGQNLVFVRESLFFCPIFKVLENHDLDKCHKIWAKSYCPLKFFLAVTPVHTIVVELPQEYFYSDLNLYIVQGLCVMLNLLFNNI